MPTLPAVIVTLLLPFERLFDRQDLAQSPTPGGGSDPVSRQTHGCQGRRQNVPRRAAAPPIRWVVIRYLEERRGPYALLCTDTEAEPLRILQWYLLRWQVEVTFEELRAHLGVETQRQWSERAIARTTPALFGLFSVGDAGGGYPDRTAWRHGAAHRGVV